MDYPIPKHASDAYQKLRSDAKRNPGLIFDRYVPDWNDQSTIKKDGLTSVRDAANQKVDSTLLKAWHARWLESVKCDGAISFLLKTQWRFISGMGRKGALEVGFTFNRYGFPYLPGSSVKGIARAAGLTLLAEALETDQLNALNECLSLEKDDDFKKTFDDTYKEKAKTGFDMAEVFRSIFGSTARAGQGVFFDAIPDGEKAPQLELDIMNPHYPKYYEGTEPPTDSQNPIPVYFLTISQDVTFWFAIGWRGKSNEELRDQAEKWLRYGLEKLGAGAKTSAGYGYFK